MSKDEALKLALDDLITEYYMENSSFAKRVDDIFKEAQPQQEPVAWQTHPFDYGIGHQGVYARTDRLEQVEMWKRKGWTVQPLYTHPSPAAPVQSGLDADCIASVVSQRYTTPPVAPVQEPVALPLRETEEMHDAVMSVIYQGVSRTNTDALWQAYRKVLTTTPPAQEIVCSTGLCYYKLAAPDLQAELDATNKQVEILSDALAESRREVAALKAVQEPVAEIGRTSVFLLRKPLNAERWPEGTKLYITPPTAQRQWVGLTDEETKRFWHKARLCAGSNRWTVFKNLIEAAHGIKENT